MIHLLARVWVVIVVCGSLVVRVWLRVDLLLAHWVTVNVQLRWLPVVRLAVLLLLLRVLLLLLVY